MPAANTGQSVNPRAQQHTHRPCSDLKSWSANLNMSNCIAFFICDICLIALAFCCFRIIVTSSVLGTAVEGSWRNPLTQLPDLCDMDCRCYPELRLVGRFELEAAKSRYSHPSTATARYGTGKRLSHLREFCSALAKRQCPHLMLPTARLF